MTTARAGPEGQHPIPDRSQSAHSQVATVDIPASLPQGVRSLGLDIGHATPATVTQWQKQQLTRGNPAAEPALPPA